GLGQSTDEFSARVQQDYPKLGALFARKDEVTAALNKTVTNLEAHSGDFQAADDLPAPGVPLDVLPVVLVVAGVAMLVTGVLVLRRPGAKPVFFAALVGLALVVPAIVLQVPQKSARAEDVLGSLNITSEAATRTREQFQIVSDATNEERQRFFPDMARAFGVSTDEFAATLGQQFPAAGAGLRDVDALLLRVEADVRFREQNITEFKAVKDFPLSALSWVLVGAGFVLFAVAGGEVVRERSRTRSCAPRPGQAGAQASVPGSPPLAATASRSR
ncbi:MAG: hypothetical protein QOI55_567, partial [Actinomycetota bacterium]|nr:hypothetical protein [Actinomycetota bacterium]